MKGKSSRFDTFSEYKPWLQLANAIIAQAEIDYGKALSEHNEYLIDMHENWFRGEDFEFLSLGYVDGEYVIQQNRKGKKV